MAITIRNKETEDLIRNIGRRTGEGPSAIIRRLAENENRMQATGQVSEAEVARRQAVFDELREKYPPSGPRMSWSEVEKEMNSIFGEDLD